MVNSIPASQLVAVRPGVLGTGGNPLSLNGVFLDNSSGGGAIPIGQVMAFADATDVEDFFGANSPEAIAGNIYFSGFIGSNTVPGTVYFVQYNTAAVAGYARGASLAGTTLTALQALSGTLTLSIDGVSTVSAAINLAAATSFSNAAALIQTGLQGGTPTNTATVTYDSIRAAFVITSPTTGSASAITVAAVDSLATGLGLTAAAGAVTSAGAAASVPATLMNAIVASTQNWFKFTSIVEPVLSVKEAFGAWVQTTDDTYCYVASDSDITPTESSSAAGSFGAIVVANNWDGVVAIYDPLVNGANGTLAAFNLGATASIDPTEIDGNTSFAYLQQAGLVTSVTNATIANNLIANGYNFYGAYATANQPFQFYQPGFMAGQWQSDQNYTNQRIINSGLQLAILTFRASVKSLPYNQLGYNGIRTACLGPINQNISFGSIQPGVTLSPSQAAAVNQAAGTKIDGTLSTVGWYLQVLDPGSVVRGQGGSPNCTFWYTSGGSIRVIDLASIDVL
jgi:hypothetical protein